MKLSLETARKTKSRQWTQYFAAMAVCLGAFQAGTWVSWTSSAIDPIVNKNHMGFEVTPSEFDLIGCLTPTAGGLFCIGVVSLMNFCGRKIGILCLAPPFVIGWCLIIWAKNVYMLYLGRIFGGFGAGTFCLCAPIYITEIAEKNIRGRLSSCYTLFFVIGITYCYVAGAFIPLDTLSISCMFLTLPFIIAFIFQPETPVYYIMNGNIEAAKNSLQYFRGNDYDITFELNAMIERENKRKTNPVTLDLLISQPARKAIIICLALQLFQQTTGIEGIFFYQKDIFDKSHIPITSDAATIIAGLIHLLFTFIASLYVDTLGRKFLLLTSGSVITLCCAVLAFYYDAEESLKSSFGESSGLIPVISLCIFRAVYALGYGPMPWIIMAEILGEDIKSSMSPLTGAFGNLIAGGASFYFNKIVNALGLSHTFLCFAAASLVGVLFTVFYVPETKKKSLDEIQKILMGKKCKKESFDLNSTVDSTINK